MVIDAIESNRAQIDSFEAVSTLKTMTTFIFEDKPLKENQTTTIRYGYEKNGKKWRCETESGMNFPIKVILRTTVIVPLCREYMSV
jgi:hypothetical protein